MADIKTISLLCPSCGGEVDMPIAVLMLSFRPRCALCRKGITVDRAWMLVEIARLQDLVSRHGVVPRRVAKPGNAED